MSVTQRRTWIQRMLSLPVTAALGRLSLFATEKPSSGKGNIGEDYESTSAAIRILRLVNTAQNWHKSDKRHYLGLLDLAKSEAIARIQSNSEAEKMGIGATLISEIDFEAKEIVAGWQLEIALSKSGLEYTARITRTKQDGLRSFATDEDGIIYEGRNARESSLPLSQSKATEVLAGPRALGTGLPVSRSRMSRLAWSLTFAVLPIPTGGCFGKGYPPCYCGDNATMAARGEPPNVSTAAA